MDISIKAPHPIPCPQDNHGSNRLVYASRNSMYMYFFILYLYFFILYLLLLIYSSCFAKIFPLHPVYTYTVHGYMLSCFSCVWLFVTPWTVAYQAPLSMGFSRLEYWSGLPCPPPRDLPNPGTEPRSHASFIGRRVLHSYHHLGSPGVRSIINLLQYSTIQLIALVGYLG